MRILIFMLCASYAVAALPSREVAKGNEAAQAGRLDQAQYHYVKALESHADTSVVMYNLGNALYGAGEYERAKQLYGAALDSTRTDEQLARTFYNMGNAGFQAQKFDEAIASYIEALRHDPQDDDARQNLELALRMKRESEQQQQQQQQDQQQDQQKQDQNQQQDDQKNDQKSDQQQDQQQQDQQKQDSLQQNQRNQQQQDQQQPQQQEPQQQSQGQQQQMTKEEAEQLLNALLQNEQNTLEQVRKVKGDKRKKKSRDW